MPSPSTDTLINQLSSDSATTRESAIARLTIVGARAIDRLVQYAASDAPAIGRTAALTALERIGDRRALKAALPLVSDPDVDVALAAVAVAGAFVQKPSGVEAIDRLTALAVDASRPASVRAAAVDALKVLGGATIKPLVERLSDDPALKFAEPAAMRTRIAASAKAPLPRLLEIVEEIREREQTAGQDERAAWLEVRGDAHTLLARRGSTIALFDLRETLERVKAPLPPGFLAAASAIGDATLLEPIAAAFASARDVYWKKSLEEAFHAIVKRHRITRRHAVLKKIRGKGLGIGD
jgi:HEAT repeat protein